jgi:lactoylglutathione lyase
VWLQLHLVPGSASATPGGGTVTRFGVPNVAAERDRLAALGVAVEPVQHVPSAVDYFDFTDLDGNRLSLYSLLDG